MNIDVSQTVKFSVKAALLRILMHHKQPGCNLVKICLLTFCFVTALLRILMPHKQSSFALV